MKDKLRELAKDLAEKEKDYAPFERRFSEELLAILDAEGDGGEVGEPRFFIDHTMIHDRVTGKHVTCDPDFRDYEINPGETTRINNPDGISNTCALLNNLAAHPARSGVVSDEDVRDAERLKEIVRRAEKVGFRRVRFELRFDPLTDTDLSLIDYIDAAIQGERHE